MRSPYTGWPMTVCSPPAAVRMGNPSAFGILRLLASWRKRSGHARTARFQQWTTTISVTMAGSTVPFWDGWGAHHMMNSYGPVSFTNHGQEWYTWHHHLMTNYTSRWLYQATCMFKLGNQQSSDIETAWLVKGNHVGESWIIMTGRRTYRNLIWNPFQMQRVNLLIHPIIPVLWSENQGNIRALVWALAISLPLSN